MTAPPLEPPAATPTAVPTPAPAFLEVAVEGFNGASPPVAVHGLVKATQGGLATSCATNWLGRCTIHGLHSGSAQVEASGGAFGESYKPSFKLIALAPGKNTTGFELYP